MGRSKSFSYSKRFKFNADQSEYVFQLKKRRFPWWLLLLPLLLLLFVKCEKDIDVRTVDPILESNLSDVHVTMEYTAYYLLKDGEFFKKEHIVREIQTDGDGRGTFEDLPCSVFSYIFHPFTRATYMAQTSCYFLDPDPESSNFHYVWRKKLKMSPKVADLELSVVDRETSEPLAGAVVEYQYVICGEDIRDSVSTTADGKCLLKNVPACGSVMVNRARCYGYADTTDVGIKVKSALHNPDSAKIKLTPIKQSFTYFVKNKYTKQPIPGATVVVTLTSSNGKVVRGQSVTNVDGKGAGAYADAFVLAKLDLQASKIHYKDGKLDGDYIVEEFAKLPDEKRTIYLEPEPYLEEFQNVDSLTMAPIPGVKNEIQISGINGKTSKLKEVSNRNGVFYVKAIEGDRIDIESELNPYYHPKQTQIDSFYRGEIILMKPVLVDLVFTTRDGATDELLPDCSLVISTSKTNISTPTNSEKGAFNVTGLRLDEEITIKASKTGYSPNEKKVRNDNVLNLMNAPQERRDIPLFVALPPCNAGDSGAKSVSAYMVSDPKSYNMGKASGSFTIKYETGDSCPDCIDLYNHEPGEHYSQGVKVFSSGMVSTGDFLTRTVNYSNGSVITVIVTTGPKDGSLWNYSISCPR